jgi:hypothetical protein
MFPASPPLESRADERRSHQRYPISLPLDYRLLHRGRVDSLGSARTINMATGGVLLQADASLIMGRQIELSINWPMLLEGVCPLKLVMWGRITRSDSQGVAIQTRQHEFRTAGLRPSHGELWDVKARSSRG